MNGEDVDDVAGLSISEADSDGCECLTDALRVCCVRFLRVRGSVYPRVESVSMGNSDRRLRSGSLCAERLAGRETSQSASLSPSSVRAVLLSEHARFGMMAARCCVVVLCCCKPDASGFLLS
jgi:hypothetical protein